MNPHTNLPNGRTKSDPFFPYYLPTARIAALLREWLEQHGIRTGEKNGHEYGLWKLANLTGIKARRIYAILYEEGVTVTFNTADAILCGLDLVDLWHIPAEEGGLADWYEADENNPLPALPEPTPRQRAIAQKCNVRRWCKKHPLRVAFAQAYAIRQAQEAPLEIAA